MIELYKAIWRVSGRRQILLIVLSLCVAGLAAMPLSYQKQIINALGDGTEIDTIYGLGAQMLALVLLSLLLKWMLGLSANLTGEDVIRVIRHRVYGDTHDGDRRREDAPETGTLVTMVSAEAEELGRFTGSAFSEPLLQLGTLASVVGYIAVYQPRLGALALLVILPQALLVILTQRKVNALVAERVRLLRHANDAVTREDAENAAQEALSDFDSIYEARRRIFLWKLSTKFALSSLTAAGTVGILMLGGWLVTQGKSNVGMVVAATMGLARLQQPWTLLIAFYRQVSAVRVKFELLREAQPNRAAVEARN